MRGAEEKPAIRAARGLPVGAALVVSLLFGAPCARAAATASSQSLTCAVSAVNFWVSLSGSGTSYTLVAAPTNGTLLVYSSTPSYGYWPWTNGGVAVYISGYVQYTPTPLYVGGDSFAWQSSDGTVTSSLALCSLTVTTNRAPVANNQSAPAIVQGSSRVGISLNVTHADSYQSMTYTLAVAPTNGLLELWDGGYQPVPTGTPVTGSYWYYTPNPGCTGPDLFKWRVCDGIDTSSNATCSITVTPNTAPVANNQTVSMAPNVSKVSVSLSFSHPDSGQTMSYTLLTAPAAGTLQYYNGGYQPVPVGTPVSSAYWYYTPATGYAGTNTFVWQMSDGLTNSSPATCTLLVNPNNPPVVNKVAMTIVCLANSTNNLLTPFMAYTHRDSGQTLTFTLVAAPTNGTVTSNGGALRPGDTTGNNNWVYQPAANTTGADSFVWNVNDGIAASSNVTVTVAVVSPPTPVPPTFKAGVKLMDGAKPLALGTRIVNGQYDWAGEGTYGARNNSVVVAAPEMVDWDNDGLMDLVVGEADGRIALFYNQGSKGRPVFNGYRYLTLSNGKEIRSYLGGCVCWGGGPECSAPRVVDWNNDGRKDLLVGEWCGNGVGLFVYLNAGTDKSPVFDFKLGCNLSANSGFPTAMPCVTDWNGDGINDLISGDDPVWGGTHGGTNNSLINIFLGTDNDHGPPQRVYNANCNNYELFNWDEYTPSDSFQTTYPTLALAGACTNASRKSVVTADWTGSGSKDLIVGLQDGTVWYAPNYGTRNFPVYTNYFRLKAGGSNVVVGSVSNVGKDPVYGTQGNMFNQAGLPAVNEARVAVGDLDGDGLLDLVVGDVNGNLTYFQQYNPKPVAIEQDVVVLPNTAQPITLTARVDSGRAVTYTVLSSPTNGTLSCASSNLVYRPSADYTGPDRFTFKVSDGTNDSGIATVSITVASHAPVTQWVSPATLSSTAIMNMNTSIVLTLSATELGNGALSYAIVTPPAHGTWNLSSNQFTYTPATNYAGPDSFAYKASNNALDSNVTTINLDVCALAVNFQPRATPVPQGFLVDSGTNFAAGRGYGWNTNLSANTAIRNRDPRILQDTIVWSSNATWTCNLANGHYFVTLSCGDSAASYGAYGPHVVMLQGAQAFSNGATAADVFALTNAPVTVTNGQLTVAIGDGVHNTGLNYLLVRPAYQPAGAVTFVQEDALTQGAWTGVYGADGYKIVTGLINYAGLDPYTDYVVHFDPYFELANTPAYAVVAGPPDGAWLSAKWRTWAFPTDDPRALQYPTLDTGIAAYWFATPSNSFSCGIGFTDGQTHRVAMYCLAWGNSSWSQRVDVMDAVDGRLLDSQVVSNFGNGKWLVWDVSGQVTIRVTCLSGFAAVSGFFFGTYAPPAIIWDPLDAAVQAGQTATFDVTASGNPLSYQWQRSDDNGATWRNMAGANAATYSFGTAPGDNGAWFQCVVSNAYGTTTSWPALLEASAALPLAPVITSPLLVTAVYGQPFTYTIVAKNDPVGFDAFLPPMCNWSLDTWFGTITASATEVWYGNNTSFTEATGTEYIVISAFNEGGTDAKMLTVVINPTNAPVVTSALSVTGMAGVAFSYAITGTSVPTSYTATGLPPGLTLNAASGLISGVPPPAATGTTRVMIGAQNARGLGLAYMTLTILDAPTITTQPASLSVPVGQPATFAVTTTGAQPLFCQWLVNGTNIVNATNAAYTIDSAVLTDAGVYSVLVSNSILGIFSSNALLTVTAVPVAPTITAQPTGLVVVVGQPATFTVAAAGTSPLGYQWMKNGTNIAGAVSPSYTIPAVALADAGLYRVMVTNYVGSATSSNALLTANNMLLSWWKLDENSGPNAMDSSGYANTGAVQGAAAWTNGALQGALSLNGTNNYIASSRTTTNPSVFTLAMWFRTTTTNGGKLIGLGNLKTGASANYDRHIYMSNAGNIIFGVYAGSDKAIVSPLTYNNGQWHHVAAMLSTAGMALYLDGTCVTNNASVTNGQNYVGYWRVGYDNLSGRASAPASYYFKGLVDDVQVYGRALAAAELTTVFILSAPAPAIMAQPAGMTVAAGQAATFGVAAAGTASLSYQWLRNSVGVAGATNATYTTPVTTTNDDGTLFNVLVNSVAGSIASSNALLRVYPVPRLDSIARDTGAGFNLTFMAASGIPYEVDWKTNLMDSLWLPCTNLIGSGGNVRVRFTNAAPQGFFEIKAIP